MFARNKTSPNIDPTQKSAPDMVGDHAKRSQHLSRQMSGACWVKCRDRLKGIIKSIVYLEYSLLHNPNLDCKIWILWIA